VRSIAVLVLAVVLDLTLGDPPGRWHPVAWIGALYGRGRARLLRPHAAPAILLVTGGGLTLAVAGLAAGTAAVLTWSVRDAGVVGLAVEALALKATLALRGLGRAGREVADRLRQHDLPGARASVGRHLVSRATDTLDEGHVASATVESIAENLTDAVVGPALFFLLLGLPGAFAYRALNTADAMIGYRVGALEYFGKVAARVDDLMNVIPARVAGVAIVVAALAVADGRRALRTLVRDRACPESPNAGWTMAAMAGALGVTLEKPGAYSLGAGPHPGARDIDSSLRVLTLAAVIGLVAISLVRAAIWR
jgi:adenosylcobinamide-phosphate synthase